MSLWASFGRPRAARPHHRRMAANGSDVTARRFPPPWTVEEQDACFVVRDHSGQQLAYVCFDDEPGRRSASTRVESKSDGPGGDVRSHHQRAVGWGFGGRAPPAHSKSVSNKRRMWPPGQQQRQQPDGDSQAFTDLCLPKVNHDDPPPQLNAVPRQKHERRFLACFVRHIRSDEQKLLCSCAQPMLGMRCLRQLLRQQESPLRGLP